MHRTFSQQKNATAVIVDENEAAKTFDFSRDDSKTSSCNFSGILLE